MAAKVRGLTRNEAGERGPIPTYRYWGSVKPPADRQPIRAEVSAKTDDSAATATIRLFDPIDSWGGPWGVSANEFAEMLDSLEDVETIDMFINSPGGDVFDGIAIFNLLAAHPATVNVTVQGIAASAASVVALAGESITMARGAQMMVHDAWGLVIGNADDMTAQAGVLDKLSQSIASLYADRAGGTTADWRATMKAETWYTPDEAVAAGLANSVIPAPDRADQVQDRFDLSIFAHAGRGDAPAPGSAKVSVDAAAERAVSALAGNAERLTDANLSAEGVEKLTRAHKAIAAAISNNATGATGLPLSDRDAQWDANAAERRVRSYAGGATDLADMDWIKYRQAFFWYDESAAQLLGSYKLPFADVIDGDLTAIWRGVTSAAAAINGAQGGVDIPAADVGQVKSRIATYYTKAAAQYDDDSITVPWTDTTASASTADAGHSPEATHAESLPGTGRAAAEQAAAADGTGAAQAIARLSVRNPRPGRSPLMDPKEKLKNLLARAQELQTASAARDLTDDELIEVKNLGDEIPATRQEIENAETKAKAVADGKALLARLGEQGKQIDERGDVDDRPAGSLGAHFVKSAAYSKAKDSKGGRYGVSAPEFIPSPKNTAGDPTTSTGLTRPDYGPVVQLPLRRVSVAALLSQGTLTNSSLTYYVQQAMAGAFDQVAEGAQKPGMTFTFAAVTAALHKIAGWYKINDEALEDSDYVASVIDNQLLVRLALAEEDAVLNSSGSGKLTGILQTSGIQTETAASAADRLPALFRALTKVQTGAEVVADGLVVNPIDYQTLRLAQDSNEQFYGGGPFTGAYGNSGLTAQPDVWGYRTVVTQAIAQGTALVGNFQTGAQLFRKGGIRVDSTNSDGTDFQFNRTMVRAEERVLLAVYQPLAFVSVNLAGEESSS